MEQQNLKGRVYLCGAGPGDPGLMTVRAMELLKSSDVVLYDRLVAKEIIDQIPITTEKAYVGRSVGDSTEHQEETNRLMVKYAEEGKQVLRLKGGDPFVFGRGAEEAEFLKNHGVDFEIVPGISSAVASPAYAGIPVTERHLSSSVVVVTGHEEGGKKVSAVRWSKMANAVDTIVVLMGTAQLPLICSELKNGGMDQGTPVGIIENGTRRDQRVITGTLDTIEKLAKEAKIKPPAVIVIGRVVEMATRIGWFQKQK